MNERTLLPDAVRDLASKPREVSEHMKDWFMESLTIRQARAVTVAAVSASVFSVPAAAQQMGDAESVMCGTGLGQAIGLAFVLAALFYVLKAIHRGMGGLDKMGSVEQDVSRQGKQQARGAVTSGFAAFVPAIAAVVFEILGIQTVTCLAPSNWSIVTAVVALPF